MLPITDFMKQEYAIEAALLGIFMVLLGIFATLFFSPVSPLDPFLPDNFLRRIPMGIVMGAIATAIVYSPWGKRSGAHTNPAVSLTFFRLGKLSAKDTFFYAIAQFIGGTVGVILVSLLLGKAFTDAPINYLVTLPGQFGAIIAFITEFLLSFGLMLMVLFTSNINQLSKYTGIFAGILVAIYIVIAVPISGMSINPARSFASALPAHLWTAFWVYYFGPLLGMLAAGELYSHYPHKPKTICYKLCPNGEQECTISNCCGNCDYLIRYWRTEDKSE